MNENIDLTKILKDCPKGTKLYSTVHGEVTFIASSDTLQLYPISVRLNNNIVEIFTSEGKLLNKFDGECTLFPSRDQRDWSKFTAPWYKKDKLVKPKFKVGDRIRHKVTNKDDVYEISKVYDDSYGIAEFNWLINMEYQDQYELVPNKFNPKVLKPFEKVLVRDSYNYVWQCDLFSYIDSISSDYRYKCIASCYKYCIPYNEDTKHLLNTCNLPSEYYIYWECYPEME